jgi:hypothetical protein
MENILTPNKIGRERQSMEKKAVLCLNPDG